MAYVYVNVSAQTHSLWLWQCQNLPVGERILRSEAIASVRDFQLKSNWIFRHMIELPTAAMFIGGVILAVGRKGN